VQVFVITIDRVERYTVTVAGRDGQDALLAIEDGRIDPRTAPGARLIGLRHEPVRIAPIGRIVRR
jgi:hypothetical protein